MNPTPHSKRDILPALDYMFDALTAYVGAVDSYLTQLSEAEFYDPVHMALQDTMSDAARLQVTIGRVRRSLE